MKPSFFRILLSAAFCIALLSCSDDDKKKSNQFTVEESTVPLLEGFYSVSEDLDDDDNAVHAWSIDLQGEGEKKAGEVWFTLYHTEGSSLTAGTYTFDGDALKHGFSFYSLYAITYDVESGNDTWYEQGVKSGTIKVEKSGETYTFTIDVVLEGDISFKGYYKGTLEED